MQMNRTALACPVCGKHMDVITHESEELSGMAAAMLGGDGRRIHREESPACATKPEWVMGWTEIQLGGEECK